MHVSSHTFFPPTVFEVTIIIMAASGSRALIYGGKGALGSVIVSHFKAKNWVCLRDGACRKILVHAVVVLINPHLVFIAR